MQRNAIVIFLSSFLLFVLQPIAGKLLVPTYGGGSSIWATTLLFFMLLLFVGYLYALLLEKHKKAEQVRLHKRLLLICAVFLLVSSMLPMTFGVKNPIYAIILTLTVSFGIPVLTLASTNTIVQSWSLKKTKNPPYNLYAVSNLGALSALLGYPLVIEPFLTLELQQNIWKIGLVVYLLMMTKICNQESGSYAEAMPRDNPESQSKSSRDRWYWLGLATASNFALIAVTNTLTESIAPVPFFWLMPLALYLISYIIPYGLKQWSPFKLGGYGVYLAIGLYTWLNQVLSHNQTLLNIAINLALVFIVFLSLHTELFRTRPGASELALYYLMIAGGGVIAGVTGAILAPTFFLGLWEYPLSLLLAVCVIWVKDMQSSGSLKAVAIHFVFGVVTIYCLWFTFNDLFAIAGNTVASQRNFYGLVTILEEKQYETVSYREMINGKISHGQQDFGNNAAVPTSYYARSTGVGQIIDTHPKNIRGEQMKIGVVGLGVGTIAAYCDRGDTIRFYEINPVVIEYAAKYFTFVANCQMRGGTAEVVEGDARLELSRELRAGQPQKFDVLVVDAFTDDAIPLHLLTREALEIYLAHLSDEGAIAFHITNGYVDLAPVIKAIGAKRGLYMDTIFTGDAHWFMLSPHRYTDYANFTETIPDIRDIQSWTDNYSNLLQILYLKKPY